MILNEFNFQRKRLVPSVQFNKIPKNTLLTAGMDAPHSWIVMQAAAKADLDNIRLKAGEGESIEAVYVFRSIVLDGHCREINTRAPPRGIQLILGTERAPETENTVVMANYGYFQFLTSPGVWRLNLRPGASEELYKLVRVNEFDLHSRNNEVVVDSFSEILIHPRVCIFFSISKCVINCINTFSPYRCKRSRKKLMKMS